MLPGHRRCLPALTPMRVAALARRHTGHQGAFTQPAADEGGEREKEEFGNAVVINCSY